ncbi:MAG: hypothetical protein DDT29_02507 [Dehalococcoidia bacterium]|nr:hypothetical protein [Bacillota bacterium]
MSAPLAVWRGTVRRQAPRETGSITSVEVYPTGKVAPGATVRFRTHMMLGGRGDWFAYIFDNDTGVMLGDTSFLTIAAGPRVHDFREKMPDKEIWNVRIELWSEARPAGASPTIIR